MTTRYEILEREVAYAGFFRMLRYRLRHGLFRGGMSEVLSRECFHRGPSVGVLPYDPDRDEVALVEQFRVGAVEQIGGPWLLEIIAGIIEPGETTEAVAVREAREEADCALGDLQFISRYLVSPGGSDEEQTLFCARADTSALGGVHGAAAEGEDIRVHVLTFDEAYAMLENGGIHAAMPIIALQWLALNRERLRDLWGTL